MMQPANQEMERRLLVLAPETPNYALREIVRSSSPILDAGFGSEVSLEKPSRAEGSWRRGRPHRRRILCCLALQA